MWKTAPLVDTDEIPLGEKYAWSTWRSLAALSIIIPFSLHLFYRSGTYTEPFLYHPIFMMVSFVLVLPDVVSGVKRLRHQGKASDRKPGKAVDSIDVRLSRDEIILRHQVASFAMELLAACGFAAVVYSKITREKSHLVTPHGMVGAFCGAMILCEMLLGSTLRYVLPPGCPRRRYVRAAHKYVSLVICVSGMLAMTGGLLGTNFAQEMIPSPAVRTLVALASVTTTVLGLCT